MATDVAQHERSNIKYYASAFTMYYNIVKENLAQTIK